MPVAGTLPVPVQPTGDCVVAEPPATVQLTVLRQA
jgi:hypothetical protein